MKCRTERGGEWFGEGAMIVLFIGHDEAGIAGRMAKDGRDEIQGRGEQSEISFNQIGSI